MELMRCVCRDVDGFTRLDKLLQSAERSLKFALEHGESLLEIVAVRRRTSAGRNVHVNHAEPSYGVVSANQDGICIPYNADVRQIVFCFW